MIGSILQKKNPCDSPSFLLRIARQRRKQSRRSQPPRCTNAERILFESLRVSCRETICKCSHGQSLKFVIAVQQITEPCRQTLHKTVEAACNCLWAFSCRANHETSFVQAAEAAKPAASAAEASGFVDGNLTRQVWRAVYNIWRYLECVTSEDHGVPMF